APAPADTPPPWVAGMAVATLLLVAGAGSWLARTAPDTLLRPHESAARPAARLARGESELRARIGRSGVTPANPQLLSRGLAPVDIRRSSPMGPPEIAPQADSREFSTERRREAQADAPAPPTLDAPTSRVASLLATTTDIAIGRAHPEANRGTDYFAPFHVPSQNNSFPSGHTSRAFALAAVVAAHTRQPALRVIVYGAAAAVGIAEVVADRHFASDVVGGAVLGTLVGQGVVRHFATASAPVGLAVTMLPGRVGIGLHRQL